MRRPNGERRAGKDRGFVGTGSHYQAWMLIEERNRSVQIQSLVVREILQQECC